MLRIAICDDNNDFARHEANIISRHFLDAQIDLYSSGEDFLTKVKQINTYDLVLLDYDMKGLTGFEVAEIIRSRFPQEVEIAFVTVFYDFSRAGYKYNALRYLVKQESTFEEELIDLVIIVDQKKTNKKTEVTIKFVDGTRTVDVNRIIYAETEGHYVLITIDSNSTPITRKVRGKISDFHFLDSFTAIRKGAVVNMQYVNEINKMNMIELKCGGLRVGQFLIARNYSKAVMLEFLKKGEQL